MVNTQIFQIQVTPISSSLILNTQTASMRLTSSIGTHMVVALFLQNPLRYHFNA